MNLKRLFNKKATKILILLIFLGIGGFVAFLMFDRNTSKLTENNSSVAENKQECLDWKPMQEPIQKRDQTKHSIPLREILDGGPGKDGIPAIDNPCYSSVEDTDWLEVSDTLLVFTFRGETRGYPIRILNWHEIVNDSFGKVPILITYCPLCGTGIVFERKIDDEEVQFGVSGKLYNSDLLMYDRKTDSLWSQITGEAVVGFLTGKKLKLLTGNILAWGDFKREFPRAKVLTRDTGTGRDYSHNPYEGYDESDQTLFPVEKNDKRLSAKERIVGIEVNSKFKAYRQSTILEEKKIVDDFAGAKIVVDVGEGGSIKVSVDGEELPFVGSFWFAWVAFHPSTELYK